VTSGRDNDILADIKAAKEILSAAQPQFEPPIISPRLRARLVAEFGEEAVRTQPLSVFVQRLLTAAPAAADQFKVTDSSE
jgi:hypothetical protein